MKQKIAIIGGGVAGITSGYLLNDAYNITLYEQTNRLGGNAYTYTFANGQEVDIAAAVFGDKKTYPNFTELLSRLKIQTARTIGSYLSFYDLDTKRGLYLTPLSIKGLMSQKFAMFKPSHILDYFNLYLGSKSGINDYQRGTLHGRSFKEYLDTNRYLCGSETAKLITICGLCLLSSMSAQEVLSAPADFFIEKLIKFRFFSLRTIYSIVAPIKRTKSYINAMTDRFRDRIVLNSNIETVIRNGEKVFLIMKNGERSAYDKLIFACPADTALKLLKSPTEKEKKLLGAWKFKNGKIVVHNDFSFFPPKELMQGFTFLYTRRNGEMQTSVNGSVWHLPGVPKNFYYISSQHPNFSIKKELTEFETIFRTPIYDFDSFATLKQLPSLNGEKNTYYCGSYFGYGLHEDAITSAIDTAKKLGVPF